MRNITASSGSLKYPESGTYGKNETKCFRMLYFISFLQVRFSFFASFNNMSTLRLRAKVVTSFYATTNYFLNKHRNGRKKTT